MNDNKIEVKIKVNAPIDVVWKLWNSPESIVNWYTASEDWHTPHAENDLKVGGKFSYRMEAKDGSFGFNFSGKYENIFVKNRISWLLDDNRKVQIDFISTNSGVEIIEKFDPENENSIEMQRAGWQAILDNFKKYIESKN